MIDLKAIELALLDLKSQYSTNIEIGEPYDKTNWGANIGCLISNGNAARICQALEALPGLVEALVNLKIEYEASHDFKNCSHIPEIQKAVEALELFTTKSTNNATT